MKIRKENGITLIALVITIIVLLILAAVTINLTIGERGIFRTAQAAAQNYTNAQERELAELDAFDNSIDDILSNIGQSGSSSEGGTTGGDSGSTGGGSSTAGKTDGGWNADSKANSPKLANTGLIPVTIADDGTTTEADTSNSNWYSYDGTNNHWANAVTKNSSGDITGYFVWIPRYAYKITSGKGTNTAGTIEIVFLQGTSNLDANGNDVTLSTYVDANEDTGAYTVHPVFQDESSTSYANGGWKSELTGFWVAKFEAGYDGTTTKSTATDAVNATLHTDYSNTSSYYGTRSNGEKLKYPVFKGNRPSMNNLGISDMYDLCLDIKNGTSMYGLSNIDSHMMKNSEWRSSSIFNT